jgi:hypothetical protein
LPEANIKPPSKRTDGVLRHFPATTRSSDVD